MTEHELKIKVMQKLAEAERKVVFVDFKESESRFHMESVTLKWILMKISQEGNFKLTMVTSDIIKINWNDFKR